jgi:hypothetical protein
MQWRAWAAAEVLRFSQSTGSPCPAVPRRQSGHWSTRNVDTHAATEQKETP